MINRLLAANRGEIARRVFHACRSLGVSTVAVYSDPDAASPHTAEADVSARLPGATPGETYLRGELLIEAARATGADAIHPGYGFLSENAEFAQAVLDAGLTWVGPSPKAIESMGSKIEAKRLMADAGVPVLGELSSDAVTADDLPVLIKASAGGGGRGMRIVRDLADLPKQLEAARAEAQSAFGDETVFCEPYVANGRHIEVQILADQHGEVWALGERECSIQRRHQKVVEEAPSPLVSDTMRTELCEAAIAAAKAIGYVGAGTVEFLADESGRFSGRRAGEPDHRFWFLEMNTRLQVEHPVTECVTGVDLVAWQLRIAEGAALPPDPPSFTGHAIEVRLYAEDPAHDWQPQAGTLHRFHVPGVNAEFAIPPGGSGLRLDSGVVDGSVLSTHYDPMLAKLIAWAPTRAEAARRLATALAGARVHGVVTNRDLLARVLRHPAFLAGETDTGFFDRHDLATLAAPLADPEAEKLSALAAALADAAANQDHAARRSGAPVLGRLPSGWRNVPSQPQRKRYRVGDRQVEVRYRLTRDGLAAEGFDGVRLLASAPDQAVLEVGGVTRTFAVAAYPDMVCADSALGPVTLRPEPRFVDPAEQVAEGSLLAPMPGTVTAVHVAEGDQVEAGAPLLVLEAMKMQHPINAAEAGVLASLHVSVGSAVDAGSVLAVVESQEEP
ncbi:MAG: biotin/lipoyl-binding protein [Micromonosporaceae bacterium]|nr:biotin/lipoyl-binding protein [Micromonosporaceae bacterium]